VLRADGLGPPADDGVPLRDAVGVELDELDERSGRGNAGLGPVIGQQAAQLLAQFGGVVVPVHGGRVLRRGGDDLVGLAGDGQRAADVVGGRAAVEDLPGHDGLL
jgi:hypothetical protein